jgi:hypothetical protein
MCCLIDSGLFRPEAVTFLYQLLPCAVEIKIPGNSWRAVYTTDNKK